MLGLCGSQSKRKAPSELTVGLNEHGFLYAKPSRGTSQEVQVRPKCIYIYYICICIYVCVYIVYIMYIHIQCACVCVCVCVLNCLRGSNVLQNYLHDNSIL